MNQVVKGEREAGEISLMEFQECYFNSSRKHKIIIILQRWYHTLTRPLLSIQAFSRYSNSSTRYF